MNLEELLEIEVGYVVRIRRTEKLGELRVRDDTALEVRVKTVVRLDVAGEETRNIRLGLLRLDGDTHEDREFIGDRAELEERILRAALLPDLELLGGERRGVNTAAALGIARLTLERLDGLLRVVDERTETRRNIRADRAERLLETNEDVGRRAVRCGRRGNNNSVVLLLRNRGSDRRLPDLLLRNRGIGDDGGNRGGNFSRLLGGHL